MRSLKDILSCRVGQGSIPTKKKNPLNKACKQMLQCLLRKGFSIPLIAFTQMPCQMEYSNQSNQKKKKKVSKEFYSQCQPASYIKFYMFRWPALQGVGGRSATTIELLSIVRRLGSPKMDSR